MLSHWPRNLNQDSGLFLTPVLLLWGSGHIDCQEYSCKLFYLQIWHSDFWWSFGMIRAYLCYHVIHRVITYMHEWLYPHRKGNSCLPGKFSYKKICGTITPLHTARWPPQTIPSFKFSWYWCCPWPKSRTWLPLAQCVKEKVMHYTKMTDKCTNYLYILSSRKWWGLDMSSVVAALKYFSNTTENLHEVEVLWPGNTRTIWIVLPSEV